MLGQLTERQRMHRSKFNLYYSPASTSKRCRVTEANLQQLQTACPMKY